MQLKIENRFSERGANGKDSELERKVPAHATAYLSLNLLPLKGRFLSGCAVVFFSHFSPVGAT